MLYVKQVQVYSHHLVPLFSKKVIIGNKLKAVKIFGEINPVIILRSFVL